MQHLLFETTTQVSLQEEHLLRLALLDNPSNIIAQGASIAEPSGSCHASNDAGAGEIDDLKQRLQLHKLLAEQQQSQLDSQTAEANKRILHLEEQQHLISVLQQQLDQKGNSQAECHQHDEQWSDRDSHTVAAQSLHNSLQEQQELVVALQHQLEGSDDSNKQLQQQLQSSDDRSQQLQKQLEAVYQKAEKSRQRCELQDLLLEQLQGQLQDMTDQHHQLQESAKMQQHELTKLQQENKLQVGSEADNVPNVCW